MSERTVLAVIAAGAQTLDDIASRCGAGARCGGCSPLLAELLARHLRDDEPWQLAAAGGTRP